MRRPQSNKDKSNTPGKSREYTKKTFSKTRAPSGAKKTKPVPSDPDQQHPPTGFRLSGG